MSAASEPGRLSPIAGLVATGGVLLGGLGLSAGYAITGVGLPCAFRILTGWSCPFCGGTRMGTALLHGDLAAAYAANPLALVALLLLVVRAGWWAIELAGGPALRTPDRLRAAVGRLGLTGLLVLTLAVVLAYAVLRNLG